MSNSPFFEPRGRKIMTGSVLDVKPRIQLGAGPSAPKIVPALTNPSEAAAPNNSGRLAEAMLAEAASKKFLEAANREPARQIAFILEVHWGLVFNQNSEINTSSLNDLIAKSRDRFYCANHPNVEIAARLYEQVDLSEKISTAREQGDLAVQALDDCIGGSYLGGLLPYLQAIRPTVVADERQGKKKHSGLEELGANAVALGELKASFAPSNDVKLWVSEKAGYWADLILAKSDALPGGFDAALLTACVWIDQVGFQIGKYLIPSQLANSRCEILGCQIVEELTDAFTHTLLAKLEEANKGEQVWKLFMSQEKLSSLFGKTNRLFEKDYPGFEFFTRLLSTGPQILAKGIKVFNASVANVNVISRKGLKIDHNARVDCLASRLPDPTNFSFSKGTIILDYPSQATGRQLIVISPSIGNMTLSHFDQNEPVPFCLAVFSASARSWQIYSSCSVNRYDQLEQAVPIYSGLHFERFCHTHPAVLLAIPDCEDVLAQAKRDVALVNSICKFDQDTLIEPVLISFRPDGVYLAYCPQSHPQFEYLRDVDSVGASAVEQEIRQFANFKEEAIKIVRLRRLSRSAEVEQKKLALAHAVPQVLEVAASELALVGIMKNLYPVLDLDNSKLHLDSAELSLAGNASDMTRLRLGELPTDLRNDLNRRKTEVGTGIQRKVVILSKEFSDWLALLETEDIKEYEQACERLDRLSKGDLGLYNGAQNPIVHNLLELKSHLGGGLRIYFQRVGDGYLVLLGSRDKDDQNGDVERAAKCALRYKKLAEAAMRGLASEKVNL